jgi:hypothetical protein
VFSFVVIITTLIYDRTIHQSPSFEIFNLSDSPRSISFAIARLIPRGANLLRCCPASLRSYAGQAAAEGIGEREIN